jgi:hypothetical protein
VNAHIQQTQYWIDLAYKGINGHGIAKGLDKKEGKVQAYIDFGASF